MHGHFILVRDGRTLARLRGEVQVHEAIAGSGEAESSWELFLQCDTAAWAHDGSAFQVLGPSKHAVRGMAVSHDNGVLYLVGSGPPP